MRKYKTIKTVALTVEPNSEVMLSDAQYTAAKHYLVPIDPIDPITPIKEQQKASAVGSKTKTRSGSENK